MIISKTNRDAKRARFDGFTLLELMIVLVIISALVTVTVPYVTRSSKGLEIEQESLNIAEAVKCAINLSTNTKRMTKLVVDPENKSYFLEIANGIEGRDFELLKRAQGAVRHLSNAIHIVDTDGFTFEGKTWNLVFDPGRKWPEASISLSTTDVIRTIRIRGKQVEIDEPTI
jgi:prepilin-type N-terminal cleavage/methylation domain-containing protein